jgi:hypothetical protein
MLIQGRSVEAAEAVWIVRKVSRHPVKNDRQAFAVTCIDQRGKIGRGAEATGWGKQAGRLIAPGTVEGMFADRQKLDMGKSQAVRVSLQFFRKLAVCQPAVTLLRSAPPRAEMHFRLRSGRSAR